MGFIVIRELPAMFRRDKKPPAPAAIPSFDDQVCAPFSVEITKAKDFLVAEYRRQLKHAKPGIADNLGLTHSWATFDDLKDCRGWLSMAVSSHLGPAYFGRGSTISECVAQIVAQLEEAHAWDDQEAIGRTLGIVK